MENRAKKGWILFFCGLLLAVLFAFYAHGEGRAPKIIARLSEAEYEALCRLPVSSDAGAWKGEPLIMGEPLPYDEISGLYYLPQSLKTGGWDGTLTWSEPGETAGFAPDEMLTNKCGAIESGHVFTLLISDGKSRTERHLVATGLPMMTLTTLAKASYALDDDAPTGWMRFYDPGAPDGYRVTGSYMTYHTRGNVSLAYPKHSYRVRLFFGNGQKNAADLLGMGENASWILNPLYTDQNRIRDGVSAALWRGLCEDAPASNRFYATFSYIEVLRDGSYYGLFGLMEPMTKRMSEAVAEGDRVYLGRIVDDALTMDMLIKNRGGLTSPAADVEYPRSWSGEDLWDPLTAYTEAFWFDAENRSAEELFSLVDADNVIDHALFTQLIANTDHNYTNNYFFAERRDGGAYVMYDVPWDFNHTFGNRFSAGPKFSAFSMAVAERDYTSRVFEVLCQKAPRQMAARTRQRWETLRGGLFSEESVLGMMAAADGVLTASGALVREADRWPDAEIQGDLSEITAFVRARLSYLDGWVEGLSEAYADAG